MNKSPIDTIVDSIISVVEGSLKNDAATLRLCNGLIDNMKTVATLFQVQSDRITQLEQRHDALLRIFYSHCEETARVIDPRDIN